MAFGNGSRRTNKDLPEGWGLLDKDVESIAFILSTGGVLEDNDIDSLSGFLVGDILKMLSSSTVFG
jgi:hypothetical protein